MIIDATEQYFRISTRKKSNPKCKLTIENIAKILRINVCAHKYKIHTSIWNYYLEKNIHRSLIVATKPNHPGDTKQQQQQQIVSE